MMNTLSIEQIGIWKLEIFFYFNDDLMNLFWKWANNNMMMHGRKVEEEKTYI